MYQQFHIGNGDQFVPSMFPQLEESLKQVCEQLANWPSTPKGEMVISFVRFHSISSQQVKDHPELATLISSQSLPLHVMEALFESGRQNSLFSKQLEDYIGTFFINKNS
jgi:hypothetical protein